MVGFKNFNWILGLLISILTCYAVNLLPIKENLLQVLDLEMTKKRNIITTFSLVLISTLLAWGYQEVTKWLQLVGSLSGVAIAFSLPGIS